MLDAILWDYDGTLADTMVKNLAVTRAVFQRLDPALLNPPPEALSSLEAYRAANYRWKNWRELYAHACGVPFACAGWSHDDPEIRAFLRRFSDFYLETVQALEPLLFGA